MTLLQQQNKMISSLDSQSTFAKYVLASQECCENILLQEQGGKCGICESIFYKHQDFVIDHDHATTLVRGLLCRSCNTLEGCTTNPSQKMLSYLSNPPAKGRWFYTGYGNTINIKEKE
jgi:hypothetical protein